jgi:quinol monooxygenase YgiN
MVHVIATVELHAGKRAAFLAEFRQIVPVVHGEEGCLEYGSAVDIDAGLAVQGPPRPDVVVIIEKWSSLEALKKHLQAPHMIAYRPKVKDFVQVTKLQVLTPAD